LHGSLAFGCYYIPKSDIDILGIVKSPLLEVEAHEVLRVLAALNDARPHTGAIELTIVLQEDAHAPQRPIPFELHFSETHAEAIKSDSYDYLSTVLASMLEKLPGVVIGKKFNSTKPLSEPKPHPCSSWKSAR
jgi:hypothetical protein